MLAPLLLLAAVALPQEDATRAEREAPPVTPEDVAIGGRLAGVSFTDAEIRLMLRDVARNLRSWERMQAVPLPNAVPPALRFDPRLPEIRPHAVQLPAWSPWLPPARRPADLEELAFADIPALAALVKTRQVSCTELAELALARLRRADPVLHCVVTLTAERARRQARALDAELAAGHWRGLLHGIPYGAKDLLAVAGAPTTWGAAPYRDQQFPEDAVVIRRLDGAGAVLVAKLSLGALAMGDVWFGGKTRNPWKPEQGSSGSSAGSAAAVAAGCVPFALGSETLGSIVSPSTRCGCSSLRPTFGRVPRTGAMALSWSMDKLGPLCRSVQDAAIVFAVLQGADAGDPDSVDRPFAVPAPVPVRGWRIGYPEAAFDRSEADARVLDELRGLGVELVPVQAPEFPVWDLLAILHAEAATAFDELTRSGRDDELTRQDAGAWPNDFRVARLIPAVEYLRASRLRTLLMREMDAALAEVDAVVHPSLGGPWLAISNLTGQPAVVAPSGFREDGTPRSITFLGHLDDEARLLALARAWQESTDHHQRHPDPAAWPAVTPPFPGDQTAPGG